MAALAVLIAGVLVAMASRRRRNKRIKLLESAWGSGSARHTAPATARKLFEMLDNGPLPGTYRLDRQTWTDLDMNSVFQKLNHCVSSPGSHVLYAMLRNPLLDEARLDQRWGVIERFQQDLHLRRDTGLALWPLGGYGAGQLVDVLWGSIPRVTAIERTAPILAMTAATMTVGALLGVLPGVLLVGIFALNTAVHFVHKRRTETVPLSVLTTFASAADRLARLDAGGLGAPGATLREGAVDARRIQRRLWPLLLDDGMGLLQYLKIFFLVDVISYWAVFHLLVSLRDRLRDLYLALGATDALRAIASYLSERPVSCAPEHHASRSEWAVRQLVHPLLKSPVPYAFLMGAGAVLITGSNMSGKTTFLKTLGVNAILTQVCHRALAAEYSLPILRVISSIGRADNLIEGRSYYLAEVESVRRIVDAARSGEPHLMLLDEIFRGTNTAERVAAGYGVLSYLANGRHLVFVATHDSELVHLLADVYHAYHFSESIGENGLSFDFTIRPGPSTRNNAIALLKLAGFPPPVIRDADRLMESVKQTR